MAAFVKYDVTVGGLNIIARGEKGEKIEFTEFALGDGFLEQAQDPHNMTGLVHEVLRVPVSGVTLIGNGDIQIRGPFSNAAMNVGFSYRELGVYAKTPELNRGVLFCYGNADDQAEWIPPSGTASTIEKVLQIVSIVGNAQNVTANLQSGISITTEDLAALLPTELVATITHMLERPPICTLYRTDQAAGTTGGGEGPAGGGAVTEITSRVELTDHNIVDVYTLPQFKGRGNPEIYENTPNEFAIIWPDETINLYLVMR